MKLIKHTKYLNKNDDVNLTSLQIRSIPIDTGLPSPVTLLFNIPIRGLLLQKNNEPIDINNDDVQYEALKSPSK